jgi:hypothetical protein
MLDDEHTDIVRGDAFGCSVCIFIEMKDLRSQVSCSQSIYERWLFNSIKGDKGFLRAYHGLHVDTFFGPVTAMFGRRGPCNQKIDGGDRGPVEFWYSYNCIG